MSVYAGALLNATVSSEINLESVSHVVNVYATKGPDPSFHFSGTCSQLPKLWSTRSNFTHNVTYSLLIEWRINPNSPLPLAVEAIAALRERILEERGVIEKLSGEVSTSPILYYAEEVIDYGHDLQRFLSTFDGISLRVDGWPGELTSDAVKQVFGFHLSGDPRD